MSSQNHKPGFSSMIPCWRNDKVRAQFTILRLSWVICIALSFLLGWLVCPTMLCKKCLDCLLESQVRNKLLWVECRTGQWIKFSNLKDQKYHFNILLKAQLLEFFAYYNFCAVVQPALHIYTIFCHLRCQ